MKKPEIVSMANARVTFYDDENEAEYLVDGFVDAESAEILEVYQKNKSHWDSVLVDNIDLDLVDRFTELLYLQSQDIEEASPEEIDDYVEDELDYLGE